MKLSDAILLGIGAVEERRNVFFLPKELNRDSDYSRPCGCAIGTALYSVGMRSSCSSVDEYVAAMQAHWPWVTLDCFLHISGRHAYGESRESIAAWIATIEPQDEPVVMPADAEKARA